MNALEQPPPQTRGASGSAGAGLESGGTYLLDAAQRKPAAGMKPRRVIWVINKCLCHLVDGFAQAGNLSGSVVLVINALCACLVNCRD